MSKLRKYDIELFDGTKFELKDWSNWKHWSDNTFRNQFIPDIADPDFIELGMKK
ncbi:MAG: hypothetical protein J5I59_05860 [Saprospiraceae bacterium]|nr:hypothetical protein [Saprospiraceae bacterium]